MTVLKGLLIEHIPIERLKSFLKEVLDRNDFPRHLTAKTKATLADDELKEVVYEILEKRKGFGYAAILVHGCQVGEIPLPISDYVKSIVSLHGFSEKKPFETES